MCGNFCFEILVCSTSFPQTLGSYPVVFVFLRAQLVCKRDTCLTVSDMLPFRIPETMIPEMVLSNLPDTHHRRVCSHLRGTAHQTIGTVFATTHVPTLQVCPMCACPNLQLATQNVWLFCPYHAIAHLPPVLATWEGSEHKEFDISRVGQHLLEQSHSNNLFQFDSPRLETTK